MRILIVDDHEVVRRGVRSLLQEESSFEVCGEAVDGRDAIAKANELKPDVVIMDISMPNINGLDATREIRRGLPNTHVVILSQHDNSEMIRQAQDVGASAYVVKSAISTDLIAALEKIGRGERSVESAVFGSAQDHIDLQEILQRSAAFESELRESEERFRATFEQAAVGIAHVAVDGHWLRVNQKLCEIIGYSQDELRQVTFQEITYPPDLARHLALRARLAAAEIDNFSLEKRYIRKDGSLIWINLTVAAVRDAERRVKYFIAVMEDISARKQVEEALNEKVSLLELSSDAIVVRDSADRIVYWSNGARELYGFTADEAVGRVTHDLFSTQFPETLEEIRRRLHADNRWSGQLTHVRKDGSKITVSSRWCLARDEKGNVRSILETNRDITAELALREIQEKLARDGQSAVSDDAHQAEGSQRAKALAAASSALPA